MEVSGSYCILAERQVGIGSAAAALEPYLRNHPAITWTDVTYRGDGHVERLPLPERVRGTLRGYLQTGAVLRTRSYDALCFLTHNPAVFRQAEMKRTPTVLWTDVTPALLDEQAEQYGHPVTRLKALRLAKHAAVRRCFHRAAMCVGWSEWARHSFAQHYDVPVDRTSTLPPGVDLSLWRTPERRPSTDLPRLLFVGGDFARKGGDLLLDVFRKHLRGRCTLDVVTRDAVNEEDGVRVHRRLTAGSPALLELYRTATVFVLPTLGDCFSIASIEAMAAGLPVVVTSVGGIPEIVEPGRSGYLIPPRAGEELRSAIDELLADPDRARRFGQEGRRLVEHRFDARRTAERLLGILQDISARPGPS